MIRSSAFRQGAVPNLSSVKPQFECRLLSTHTGGDALRLPLGAALSDESMKTAPSVGGKAFDQ